MAIKEDKSFIRTQIGFRSLLQGKGRGVFVSTARCLSNVLNCFIQLSKNCGESVLLSCKSKGRAGKRGLNKSCSAVTASYSSVSKGISKSKIILISASLIRPFNSMSTTMQTLPYLS